MSRKKSYNIQVWFLAEDLDTSARFLSDKFLDKSIKGCVNALIASRMYFYGFRTKRIYNYYFSKEHLLETIQDKFPCWPFKKLPGLNTYSSKYSKFTRQCQEHYEFTIRYLRTLLDEWSFRFSKEHQMRYFDEWLLMNAPKIDIPLANLEIINIPWKDLPPQYRNENIILGYRSYYIHMIQNLGLKIDSYSRRDIPDFLLEKIDIQY